MDDLYYSMFLNAETLIKLLQAMMLGWQVRVVSLIDEWSAPQYYIEMVRSDIPMLNFFLESVNGSSPPLNVMIPFNEQEDIAGCVRDIADSFDIDEYMKSCVDEYKQLLEHVTELPAMQTLPDVAHKIKNALDELADAFERETFTTMRERINEEVYHDE